jgi:predicted nucleotidyltransferase component of viral defense system
MSTKNIGMSVRMRLATMARAEKKDLTTLFHHYMVERLLYRLSQTDLSGLMVLKGGMLFSLWYEETKRTTRDADFLALIDPQDPLLKTCIEKAMAMDANDGLTFDVASLEVKDIKKINAYPGTRLMFYSHLNGARIRGQLDVSFGDLVTGAIPNADFPVILNDMPTPHIPVYPMATVIAEKLQTMCSKGETNTRLKDFFDVSMILSNEKIDAGLVQASMAATFAHRDTETPAEEPVALSAEFGQNNEAGWKAFIRKNQAHTNLSFQETQDIIREFAMPLWEAINAGEVFEGCWSPTSRKWGAAEAMPEPLLVPQRKHANEIGLSI